jgi:signal transduction histidine kinase
VLNVVATDMGRPIGDVKTRLDIPELGQLITKVMEDLSPHSQEVQDREGRWYDMRIRPYRSFENKMDGAVLTWSDISILKGVVDKVVESRDFLMVVLAALPEPLLTLDTDLRVISANQPFCDLVQATPESVVNQFIYELGNRQWDIPELRGLLEKTALRGTPLQDFEVEQDVADTGRRALLLNARRVASRAPHEHLILLSIQDITAVRQLAHMEQLRHLSARLQAVREEERTTLAREVHDELGGQLTGLKMDVARFYRGLTEEQTPLREQSRAISALIDATVATVRGIATSLRPGVLDNLGLLAAIDWQLSDFQKRTGLSGHLVLGTDSIDLSSDTSTALFRVFQEALTNIARHAEATEVNVSFKEQAGYLVLEVHDNGRGITDQEMHGAGSLGLLGMRERIGGLDGHLDIQGTPGQGTIVRVMIPHVQPVDGSPSG